MLLASIILGLGNWTRPFRDGTALSTRTTHTMDITVKVLLPTMASTGSTR